MAHKHRTYSKTYRVCTEQGNQFSMTVQNLIYVCFQDFPFSMSFQDCVSKWILNKSDFHMHLRYQIPSDNMTMHVKAENM